MQSGLKLETRNKTDCKVTKHSKESFRNKQNDSLRLQIKKKMNLQCNWEWKLATSIHYIIEK